MEESEKEVNRVSTAQEPILEVDADTRNQSLNCAWSGFSGPKDTYAFRGASLSTGRLCPSYVPVS